jgi:hypothetical protein
MIRCAAAFTTVALTALFLGLLEPALAASDAARLFFVLLALAFLRSPLWLTSLFANGRAGRT